MDDNETQAPKPEVGQVWRVKPSDDESVFYADCWEKVVVKKVYTKKVVGRGTTKPMLDFPWIVVCAMDGTEFEIPAHSLPHSYDLIG
jgi:hypothetical protein